MFAFEGLSNTTKITGIKLKIQIWERLSMYCSEEHRHNAWNLDAPNSARVPPLVCQSPEVVQGAFQAPCTWAWVQSARLDGNTIVLNKSKQIAGLNAPKTSPSNSESDLSWSWSKFAKACRFTRQTPPSGMSTGSSKRTSWTQLFVSAKRFTWLKSGRAHGSTVSTSPSESPDSISTKSTSSTPPSRSSSGASGTFSRNGIPRRSADSSRNRCYSNLPAEVLNLMKNLDNLDSIVARATS